MNDSETVFVNQIKSREMTTGRKSERENEEKSMKKRGKRKKGKKRTGLGEGK